MRREKAAEGVRVGWGRMDRRPTVRAAGGGGQVAMGYSLRRSSQRRVGEEIAGVGVWGTALSPLFS